MIHLDLEALLDRLHVLESIALVPRVSSTNMVARRIVGECIENELSLPQAIIIAGEQFAGIGRNARRWSSPAGKGIYATTLLTVTPEELPMVPLQIANIVAGYLRATFGIDARIKWPNDVLAGREKIAGILIEARSHEDRVYLVIGTGINLEPAEDDTRPNAVAVAEVAPQRFHGVAEATMRFIEYVDEQLRSRFDRARVLEQWRSLAIHQTGDPIECIIGERNVRGTWAGIDEHGRALLRQGDETLAVSAGDLILG